MATKDKEDFRLGIDNRLRELQNVLDTAEKDEATEDALDEYSKDKPDTTADDITADGVSTGTTGDITMTTNSAASGDEIFVYVEWYAT